MFMLIPTPHVNDCRMFNFPDSTPLVVMRNYKYSQVMYENSTNLDLALTQIHKGINNQKKQDWRNHIGK